MLPNFVIDHQRDWLQDKLSTLTFIHNQILIHISLIYYDYL